MRDEDRGGTHRTPPRSCRRRAGKSGEGLPTGVLGLALMGIRGLKYRERVSRTGAWERA